MIANRLMWFLETNNLLNPKQAGFRKNFSTADPVIRVVHEAEIAYKSGNIMIAIFIDFSRAFDLLWIDGLLIKLMKLNITGPIFRWIKNFLSDRTNQVKIGNDLSESFTNDNGTPQGCALSPLLFLIMINDFPKLSTFTSDAFFADDSTIWRSGNNLAQIIHHLQADLDAISKWCLEWGFKINIGKTQGIMFTRKKLNAESFSLKIQGQNIKFESTVKLLGVILDAKLTWKPHIEYLITKTKNSLNLMKCISGASWGASKDILLTLYKTLILSHLDYCCFAYAEASTKNLKKLDSIQYKALLIAVGGIKGTALNALLGECGELPLKIRRDKFIIKYLLKLKHFPKNTAYKVMEDNNYQNLGIKNHSKFNTILESFMTINNLTIDSDTTVSKLNPPWLNFNDFVDTSLLYPYDTNKNELSNELVQIKIGKLESTYSYIIYADGSVGSEGKVGAAFFCPNLSSQYLFHLKSGLSIYYAESFAILRALIYSIDYNLTSFCIVSDNSTVLKDIKLLNTSSSPHPYIITQICNILSKLIPSHNFLLTWLPGHHHANQNSIKTDKLAKLATTAEEIYEIKFSTAEATLMIDECCRSVWYEIWRTKPTCKYQYQFEPFNGNRAFYSSRKKDVIVSRLRLLQTNLLADKYKVGLSDNDECPNCNNNSKQDVIHFLMSCAQTKDLREKLRRNHKDIRSSAWNIESITSNKVLLDIVVDYIINHSIEI